MDADAQGVVWSDQCMLDDLIVRHEVADSARTRLVLGDGWPRRWTSAWRFAGAEVVVLARDLNEVSLLDSEPVRRFTWRPRQRHRPGLAAMVSTGRLHGFESLEEARLLLALDFLQVAEVLPQPFRLRFEHRDGWSEHTPDFLALLRDGSSWLFDVRPARLIEIGDLLKFAATDEVALASGWRYSVVSGWRPHVGTVLDALSAQRRPLDDPVGVQPDLFARLETGQARFLDLVQATRLPAVARAHAIHLLWHRQLGVEFGRPLGDDSIVRLAGGDRR